MTLIAILCTFPALTFEKWKLIEYEKLVETTKI